MEKTVDLDPNIPLFEVDQKLCSEIQELLLNLPREKNWDGNNLSLYQGFWYPSRFLHGMISFQRHCQAQDSDIILITFPKSGTIWLKALSFTIVNRCRYALQNSPLLSTSAHDLVPFLDLDIYMRNQSPTLEDLPAPRIFSTHASYSSLPDSIKHSNCRIVYMCRNPLDQFISHWKFLVRIRDQTMDPISLDEAFEMVCNGVQGFGPIWEHVLGYWKASEEDPQKILFLKYEDLKEDINCYAKKLANFLGCPFTEDEEGQGVIKEISKLCSFDNMKNVEVNKTGKQFAGPKNNAFFRKGEMGDWKNYLTPSMSECLENLMKEKFGSSGLSFKTS